MCRRIWWYVPVGSEPSASAESSAARAQQVERRDAAVSAPFSGISMNRSRRTSTRSMSISAAERQLRSPGTGAGRAERVRAVPPPSAAAATAKPAAKPTNRDE